MSSPVLYYLPDLELLAYYWNNIWYDASNLTPFQPESLYTIPIYDFNVEPTSDPVFVQMDENWILFQTSGKSLIKLADYLGSSGAKVISHIVSLANPYGSRVGFDEDRFRDLVNIKTLGISLL